MLKSLRRRVARHAAIALTLLLLTACRSATSATPHAFAGETGEASFSKAAVRVTYYYATGNPTASGWYPYAGSAACSFNFPMGTTLAFPDGRVVVCLDRGRLGSEGWVDVFAPSAAYGRDVSQTYGDYSEVVILCWGWCAGEVA